MGDLGPVAESNGRTDQLRVLLMSNMYPSASEPGYGSFVARQERRLAAEHGVSFRRVVSSRRGEGSANLVKYGGLLLRTLAATARGGFDLVHAHYLLPVAAFALIPCVVRGKPLVITAHGTDIYSGRRPFWHPHIVRALRRASRVQVVSEFLGRELVDGFGALPPGRLFVADMGVDTELFTPGDASAAKAARGLPLGVPHLLFVGNFVEQKGVTDLAEALVALRERGVDFRATLLGHGPLDERVRATISSAGDSVSIAGVVPHAQLVDVFRSADLFVLPSRREGVGLLVCLEALSCGVPVAAGRAGGLPEIVHDGQNGVLLEPGEPARIADTIEQLLGDPERLAELAARARPSALAHDERVQAAKVAAAYWEVTGRT